MRLDHLLSGNCNQIETLTLIGCWKVVADGIGLELSPAATGLGL